MLSSVFLSVLAGVLSELGYLWSSFLLGPEGVLTISANNAQYLATACIAALRFLHRGPKSSQGPIAPVLNVRADPECHVQHRKDTLPGLDDTLVDRLFLRTQAARSGGHIVRQSTSTITARIG